jgi:hypothetical protein
MDQMLRDAEPAWDRRGSLHPQGCDTGPSPHSGEDQRKIGRRGASRLRICLPARLDTITGRTPGVIHDLSQSGARLRLQSVPRAGADVVITIGRLEAFATVVWANDNFIGLKFYDPLSLQQVLDVRAEAEKLPASQRRELSDAGQLWCQGRFAR